MSSFPTDLASAGAAALEEPLGAPVEVLGVDELPALPAGGLAGTRTAVGGTGFAAAIAGEPPAAGADAADLAASFAAGAAPVAASVLGVPAATAVTQPAPSVTAGPDARAYRCRLGGEAGAFEVVLVVEAALGEAGAGPDIAPAAFPELGSSNGSAPPQELSVLADVAMSVTVELGRARMKVRDLLSLNTGSVVELDRAAGAAVDVLVNGTVVARGDVVVIDEELGVRITEVVERA